tara:strand:+ start:4215 stop:4940 length:726 start_codon:yes stop_codon:yes gene_type:complete
MIIVTGASDNHYFTLIQFINSFIKNNINGNLIIYDLGIHEKRWTELQEKYTSYNFSFKVFEYTKYPDWFDINVNRGEYAWKPAIIYETYKEFDNEIIIWMDSGNLFLNNLNDLVSFIERNYIHSGITSGNIQNWTHPNTINLLGCNDIYKPNRNGACIGFNTRVTWVKEFIETYHQYCSNKDAIAPLGSSRENHRQDQAVFTILFYKFLDKYKFTNYTNKTWNVFIGYSIHNDIGGSDNPR